MRARRLDSVGTWALLALSAVVLALSCTGFVRAAPEPLQAHARGGLRIAGSGGERAILSGSDLAPGGTVRGSVAIRDRGSRPATLVLAGLHLRNGGGGPLSSALLLTVRDITRRSDGIIYSGPLSGLRRLRAGALAPGQRRRYLFEATVPDPGPGVVDDTLAGAWTRVDFRWRLKRATRRRCATRFWGDAGRNRIFGTVRGDRIRGGAGPDRLVGGRGRDCLLGGAGPDRLLGGPGDDRLVGGPGHDLISGGPGDDRIFARDGVRDRVECGPGDDLAVIDRFDRIRGCERVKRPKPLRPLQRRVAPTTS